MSRDGSSDDMARGYLDGFGSASAALPECHPRATAAYRHGWLNGRDDRVGRPRERASVLRRRADMCLDRNTKLREVAA